MAWSVKFDPRAVKELRAFDQVTAKRILKFARTRLADSSDPRTLGTALKGDRAGLWRWRVGDYRLIGEIRDRELVILVIAIGHRREIYR